MRKHSFGKNKLSFLDKIIFSLRKNKILSHLSQKTEVVVDMGCGYDATLLRSLLQKKNIDRAIGVDLSFDEDIQSDKLSLLRNDLNGTLDISDNSVDIVLSLAVIEHLDSPDKNLAEVYRILKPKGKLILTTPAPRAKPILEFMAYKLKIIDSTEIEDHKNYFFGKDLKEMLTSVGFKDSNIQTKTFLFGLNNLIIAIK